MTRLRSRALHVNRGCTHPGALSRQLLLAALAAPISLGQATPVRVADKPCEGCHREIYRTYLATPMANASGPAVENLKTADFLQKPSEAEYRVFAKDGAAHLTARAGNEFSEVTLSYFLGSGHLGTTYLYSIGKYLFESPVAWYAPSNGYDMKPGLAGITQIPPPLPMQSSCMRCHMSSVQRSDPGTVNRYQGAPFLHSGITCEACHGESEQHVLTKGKAAILNPDKVAAERRDSICISCHLEGDVSVERAGHSALEYHPGERIATYLAYYVRNGADPTARGVSEVEQLSRSTCKRMSGDRMSCTSCHDPHYRPDAQHRLAFYRAKCLSCHSDPAFSRTHHPENQDCTSCHMPTAQAANILHVAWTDHRILRVPESDQTQRKDTGPATLDPIFSPGASERDLAMAYYELLLEGDRSYETPAWEALMRLREKLSDDKEALDALGNLAAEREETQIAEAAFCRVLELDPVDLTALSNLAILRAREGNVADAVSILHAAFERNEDIPGLAMNLARVQHMQGDDVAAEGTLKDALKYCPNVEDIQRLLRQLSGRLLGSGK